MAKFRCGTAPIRIETGRYEGLLECHRYCPYCSHTVEDEYHVLFQCPLYSDLREEFVYLLNENTHCTFDFNNSSKNEKLSLILSSDNDFIVRQSAKYCSQVLERRRCFYS
jgi:hypothetical protein